MPPGRRRRSRAASRASCSPCSCSTSSRAAPPARLRAAPERAETGARHVGQHPGEPARPPRRPGAVGHHDQRSPARADTPRTAGRTSSARCGLSPLATSPVAALGGASPVSSAVLPPGPAHRSSHGPGDAVRPGQRPGHQLRSLVLDPDPALPYGGQLGRVARPSWRRTASAGRARPPRRPARPASARPGRTARVTAASTLFGRERRLELGGRERPRRTRRRSSADGRSGSPGRRAGRARRSAGRPSRPGPRRPPSAEHRVDQPGDPLPHRGRGRGRRWPPRRRGPAPRIARIGACRAGAGRARPAAALSSAAPAAASMIRS